MCFSLTRIATTTTTLVPIESSIRNLRKNRGRKQPEKCTQNNSNSWQFERPVPLKINRYNSIRFPNYIPFIHLLSLTCPKSPTQSNLMSFKLVTLIFFILKFYSLWVISVLSQSHTGATWLNYIFYLFSALVSENVASLHQTATKAWGKCILCKPKNLILSHKLH